MRFNKAKMIKIGRLLAFICLIVALFLFYRLLVNSRSDSPTTVADNPVSFSQIDWSKASSDAKRYVINFEQIEQATANGAKFYDVRTQSEYQLSHFRGAENWPLQELERGTFPQLSKQTPIYLYCQSGKRSAHAKNLFRQAGFEHVFDLGGIKEVEIIGGKKE